MSQSDSTRVELESRPEPNAPRVPAWGSRAHQVLRWSSLLGSTIWLFVVPLLHLGSIAAANPQPHDGRWAELAQTLPSVGKAAPLGSPWSVQLFGLEIMDPLAGLAALTSGAFELQILWAVIPALILVGLFGRFFCGWICPYRPILAVSNAVRALLAKLGLSSRDLAFDDSSAFVVLFALLLMGAITGGPIVSLFYPPIVIGREIFRAVFFGSASIGLAIILFAFLFDTFVSKAGFCRFLCPGGALFRVLGRPSPVRVERDPQKCTYCRACDVACNLGQKPMTDMVTTGCERCGLCVASCNDDALHMRIGHPLPIFQSKRASSTEGETAVTGGEA